MFICYSDTIILVKRRNVGIFIILMLLSVINISGSSIADINTLSVSLSGATEVDEGSAVNLTVIITTDNLTDVSIELLSSAGKFDGNTTDIIPVNGTKTLYYIWNAPNDLVDTVTATITVNVNAELLSDSDSLSITVSPIISGFKATWDVPSEVNQTDIVSISLTVVDNVSLLPVNGADVALLSEIGVFSNEEDLINLQTDAEGKVSAKLNLTSAVLVSATQNVALSASISKNKFDPYLTNSTVLVHRVQVASVSITHSKLEISNGESVYITVDASINGLPWDGATVQVEADGGFLPNGDTFYKAATNSSGLLVIEWTTNGLPLLTSDTIFHLTVKIISADFSIADTSLNVTVSANISNTFSLPSSSVDGAPIPLVWAVFSLIGLVIFRRRLR